MWNRHNVHKMYINIYRNPKTRNWFRYGTLLPLSKRFFDMRRERHNLSQPNQRAAPVAHKFVWPRPTLNVDLSHSAAGTQLTAFSQISAHASDACCHPNTLVPIPIWDFYFDISEWLILSARAWTPALMLHLTNPCTKRKVLSLTKPKGKIYKTKFLGNYITDCTITVLVQSAWDVAHTDSICSEGNNFLMRVLIWHNTIWWQGSSDAGAFGNTKYTFHCHRS